MSNLKIAGNRLSIFVFNILILVLSAIITTVYITTPFWIVEAHVTLDKEQLTEFIKVEDYPNANLDVALKDGIEFNTDLEIPANLLWETNKEMLKSLVREGTLNPDMSEPVKNLLDAQMDEIVDSLMLALENVALEIAKSVAAEQAKQSIISSLTASSGNTDIEQKLEAAGYDDGYFGEKMDDLSSALQEENKTVDEATEIVVNTLSGIITDLQSNEDETLSSITAIDEETLRQKVKEGLSKFENEDNVINIEDAIAILLLNGLDSLAPQEESYAVTATPASAQVEPESENVAKLKEDVKAKLYELLPENVNDIIATFLKISAGVLLLSIITWAYVAIKILFKFFYADNSVKLKAPLILGYIPGLVLWLVPTLVSLFTKNTAAMQMISLYFGSSGMWAVIAAFALFVISIPYCSMRKALKPRKFNF